MLTKRLSVDSAHRVLLLAAGGKNDYFCNDIPVGDRYIIGNPRTECVARPSPKTAHCFPHFRSSLNSPQSCGQTPRWRRGCRKGLGVSRPEVMGRVPGIVYRCIATHLIKKAGFSRRTAQAGAVTLIQRFGSALNLNVHFHMLFLDGVYVDRTDGSLQFRWVKAPTSAELINLAATLARRIGRHLERQGLLESDAENSYLVGDDREAGPMEQRLGSSVTYRNAIGRQQGRKVFTLQTLSGCGDRFDDGVGKVAGFSLHAGVAARADERHKLEPLCRYISGPAIVSPRLSLTRKGDVRYQLKTPYRDGTTHVIFEPLDFIARLAALAPKPRVNLTRFHGVFAPHSNYRARVTPASRSRGADGS